MIGDAVASNASECETCVTIAMDGARSARASLDGPMDNKYMQAICPKCGCGVRVHIFGGELREHELTWSNDDD